MSAQPSDASQIRIMRQADLEAVAQANGYPPDWPTLYASLANDENFAAPPRGTSRSVPELD